jgi:hypothetical protein
MTPSGSTGRIAPAWVREEIARHRRAWPLAVLAAGLLLALAAGLVAGVAIWTRGPLVCYALP